MAVAGATPPLSREEAARERFARDTAEHALTVLHDDGVYRHLRLQKPGTSVYFYDLTTWPGYLAISGDAGHYLFARLYDMFEFFAEQPGGESVDAAPASRKHVVEGRINPGYWAEKLRGPREDSTRRYSPELFTTLVGEWCEQTCEELEEDEAAGLRAAVAEQLLSGHPDAADDERTAHQLLRDFEYQGRRISDSWEWDLRDFDNQFLWCCWAILDGIARYRALPPKTPAANVESPRPGSWEALAAGLDEYHAVNLREALKLVPDTGDWHGSLRAACEIALADYPQVRPNRSAEQMREQRP